MFEPEQTPENGISNNPFTDAPGDFGENIINKTKPLKRPTKKKKILRPNQGLKQQESLK